MGFSVVTVGLEPTSATSMVVTPHCGDHSLSVEKAADEIPSTGGHRRLSPIDVFTSPAIVDQKPCCNHKKIPTREGWIFFCGDSWTRTNDPIDVNDVLCRCGSLYRPKLTRTKAVDPLKYCVSEDTAFVLYGVRTCDFVRTKSRGFVRTKKCRTKVAEKRSLIYWMN